ncbi:uncharacterized protein LOC116015963 [Ipomoea triloba]|uniref:uncharacterized protein LOC116015963 n=1 Tax=Ipomoea triloba TaxID=35885 RepID=UPI00125D9C95|nr:uncharacterized protein LOC116015963 [Ipomoea triloba]
MCVEVDITQPLISRFTLEEKVWLVAYEGMHLVCFSCGLYGHRQDCCPTVPQKDPEEADHEGNEQGRDLMGQQSARAPTTMGTGGITARPYGPWMIAQRRERRQNGKPAGQGRQVAAGGSTRQLGSTDGGLRAGGSRFAPLGNDNGSADHAEEELRADAAGGKVVSSTRVSTERTPKEIPVDSMTLIPEHHGDPPVRHDDEGDVVMEIEEQQATSLAEAGLGGPPVTEEGQEPWFYSVVYGSPSHHLRRRLWAELSLSKLGFAGPWMLAVDFNAVVCQEETSNYSSLTVQRSSDFVSWIHDEGLIDLGFSGPRLTWIKGNSSVTAKGARLDRALCNIEWRQRFPNASVVHLPRISSDHAPILIRREDVISNRVRPSFKFQATWFTDKGFSEVVENTWRRNCSLHYNITRMTATLDRWNRDIFGNILRRKRSLLARLHGVQRRIASGFHAGLSELEKKLAEKYHEVLYQEELLWFQRSREEWIVSGDRNTAYYHAVTTIQNSQNSIASLRDGTGDWIMDGNNLKDHVRNFYMTLFAAEASVYPYHRLDGAYPRLIPEEWSDFNKDVSMAEVHNALTSMAPFKAPGPDGFHAAFY